MSFVDFVVLPPGHGRSVTDFWGWDAHEAQLRFPDGVWVVIEEDVVPGGAFNLNSTNLPRTWSPRESSPSRNRDLRVSSQRLWPLDHEAGRTKRYKPSKLLQNCIHTFIRKYVYLTISHYISCNTFLLMYCLTSVCKVFVIDTMHEKCIIWRFEIAVFSVMGPSNLNGQHRRFGLNLLLQSSDGLCRQTQNAPPKH